ncbi:GYD domain-containing protein [Pseudonocardia sp. C8]|uniref:GYD domain-containing protein n=1 Tax=Pseudonocardia sp. C8 TaxID=2762759 RepID=UPI0016433BC0|nr:GYD domain-containing protein [Pseudonocardia sp. C8]MBC3193483.1 GYD domain-containing protein [Pseudonocardia sp. C8]
MTRYVLFFSYTPEAWRKMIDNPGDRAAAARAVLEPVGGTLESLYFMFGETDGMAICDVPDAEAAAAAAIAVASSGAFRNVRTHELIEPERLRSVLGKAGQAAGSYPAPGT